MRTFFTILVLCLTCTAGCGDDDASEADLRGIGAECSNSEDCFEQDQVCLTQFTGGYCGRADCTGNLDCPANSACVAHGDGVNYCFRICIDKAECNRNRSPDNWANCSSNITFVEPETNIKACVPPSSGTK